MVVELCKSRSAVVALNGSHLLEEDLGALLGLGSSNPDNDKERYHTHTPTFCRYIHMIDISILI